MNNRVMVAMSGGVDSSAAAVLLQREGYELCGVTLRLYDANSGTNCGSVADVEDARQVCGRLGMRHYVFHYTKEFENEVIRRFADGYASGSTPNPCICCNRFIKFGRLLEQAKEMGYGHLATGHYARVEFDAQRGRWLLKKAKDQSKDQTYVLYSLSQDALSHALFPMGELYKTEGRRLAMTRGLLNADRPDSQDICFVPGGDYAGYLRRSCAVESSPGDFVDENGKVLGRHKGLIHYTIGQRKGLGLSLSAPLYVLHKDCARNEVVLGPKERLYSDQLLAGDCNSISIEKLDGPLRVTAKTRYSQAEAPAVVECAGEGKVSVRFDAPQRALTPGQAVVFYDGDVVVGGATILASQPSQE